MKTFSGLILILLLNISLSAQNVLLLSGSYLQLEKPDSVVDEKVLEMVNDSTKEETIFFIVEEMPTFQGGGIDEFRKYLMNEIRIPEISVENGISTRFVGRFIVNKEGYIKDVEILRSLDPLVDEEIKRVMLASPKWEPGKQNGIPVNVQFVMPIHITFQ